LVRFCAARIIHQAIILERTVVDFAQFLNLEHNIFGGIPAIHQNSPKSQAFWIDNVQEHVLHVGQLGLPIARWVINPVVDNPELVYFWIDVHTCHPTDPFDDAMGIATVLSSH
jgi:hypothetical protein